MQHAMTGTYVISSLTANCLFADDYVWDGDNAARMTHA